ncbi:MAG: hypothetical protein H0W76_03090 [Pyrinomonadaceae bacterium]|nr:hypothetical protein [Pyrinomonadaceae bacterium]
MSLSRLANFFGTVSAAFNKPSQDNGQTPPTTRGGCTTLTCTPTNGNWLTPIFGKFTSGGVSAAPIVVSPQRTPNGKPYETVPTKLPAAGDARTIRNTILREHFNYTRSDITALDHTPNAPDFYIADRRHPQRAATPEEVKEWHRLVRKDGTIEIPVATSKAKELREFRQMNAAATERAVQLATSNITDPAARQAARSDLLKLLSDNGHERVSAAARLSELARLNKPEAAGILKATWAMTEHPSYAKNPSLRLTLARIEMDQIRGKSGPGLDLRAKELAGEALKLAGGYDPVSNRRRRDLSVDKSEGRWSIAMRRRFSAKREMNHKRRGLTDSHAFTKWATRNGRQPLRTS